MRKSVKTLITIGAVLAIADISDMIAKGQMLNVINTVDSDAADDTRELMGIGLRPKMIKKTEKAFRWITDQTGIV